MDQPKIERLLQLIKLLCGNTTYTIDDIACMLGTSSRTIYRYIDTFKSAGFVLKRVNGNVYQMLMMPSGKPELENALCESIVEAYKKTTGELIIKDDTMRLLGLNTKNYKKSRLII